MKKLLLVSLLGLTAVSYASVGDSPYTLAMKNGTADLKASPHDNGVLFYYGEGVNSIRFEFISQNVTPGQEFSTGFWKDWEGQSPWTNRYIDIFQGRKKDGNIGNEFLRVTHAKAYSLYDGNTNRASLEMNFFVTTNMYINGSRVTDPVSFGQYNPRGSENYWMIGSPALRIKGLHQSELVTEDGRSYKVEPSDHVGAFGAVPNEFKIIEVY